MSARFRRTWGWDERRLWRDFPSVVLGVLDVGGDGVLVVGVVSLLCGGAAFLLVVLVWDVLGRFGVVDSRRVCGEKGWEMSYVETGDSEQTVSEYSSWRPVAEALGEMWKGTKVVEVGMGNNSTPYFYEHASGLWSIEHDEKWAKCLGERHFVVVTPGIGYEAAFLGGRSGKVLEWVSEKEFGETDWFSPGEGEPFEVPGLTSLVFVDGHATTRLHCAHWAMARERVNLVLLHDFEVLSNLTYQWCGLRMPDDWYGFRSTSYFPHTGVLVRGYEGKGRVMRLLGEAGLEFEEL